MATLSASRRNSAASSSPTSNSPRPSISSGFFDGTYTPPLASLPTISALNEYDTKYSHNSTPSISSIEDEHQQQHDNGGCTSDTSADKPVAKNIGLNSALKISKSDDEHIKVERKPYSNAINSRNIMSTTKLISERTYNENNNSSTTIRRQRSLDKFPRKLERIVEIKCEKPLRQLSVDGKSLTKLSKTVNEITIPTSSSSALRSLSSSPSSLNDIELATSEPVRNTKLSRSFSIDAKTIERRKPIMKSDFTNTVSMRKHSLEMNAQKAEKSSVRPKVVGVTTTSGVVSMLKQRFSSESIDSISSNNNDISGKFCMNFNTKISMEKSYRSNVSNNNNTNISSRYSFSPYDNNKIKINLVRSKSNTDNAAAATTSNKTKTTNFTAANGSDDKPNDCYKSIRLKDDKIKRSDRTNLK